MLGDFYQTQPGDNIAPSYQTHSCWVSIARLSTLHFEKTIIPPRSARAWQDATAFGMTTLCTFFWIRTTISARLTYWVSIPLGIQSDGIVTESTDGSREDLSLDIVMDSKGSLTEDGYVVEVAIPFKSLRYEAGKGKLWGFNAVRRIRRLDNENDSWMPISRDKSGRLNQEGHLTGLEGISTERTLEIIPTFTLSETGRRVRTVSVNAINADPNLRDPGRFVNRQVETDPGLNIKFGITPTITLDLTANPDFAQVEADQPVLTANQRFPIFFSEKRPFFLEGADIFQTPLQAVHTRTIIDPDYAIKLSGKQGRNSFGLLLATDNAPGNFTEDERNDPELFPDIAKFIEKNAYVGVLRFKQDIGKENSLGIIATSYNFTERHNQLAGFDGYFRLDPQKTFSFQVLGTTSRGLFFNPELNDSVYRSGNAGGLLLEPRQIGTATLATRFRGRAEHVTTAPMWDLSDAPIRTIRGTSFYTVPIRNRRRS